MKKNLKPGQFIWCAEGTDVKQVEITTFQRDDLTATRVKLPNDNITRPWRCWDGYLFKTRKAAVRQAIKQMQERIQANNSRIDEIKQENKELENDIRRLQQETT